MLDLNWQSYFCSGEAWVEGDHLKDPGVDERIILKYILERLDGGGIAWTDLAQDRDRWRAVVNMMKNLRVP
jgi:hypothetical protein